MQFLLIVATGLQIVAVVYGVLLLRRHRIAARAWLCLLGALLSMLAWRVVVATGATPGLWFTTLIAIWGSVCAVLAMFFFSEEVARRERAEGERDRLLTSERSARSDADRASRIKDEFMATLSHELRSPLAAILGWCAILRRTATPADVERATDTIERNARMQTRLVEDLLDATRMQAGSLRLELTALPLDVPVAAAIDAVRPEADAKQVAILFSCGHPRPIVVGDATRLQQIASNLLVNAVKFTPAGRRVTVTVRAASDSAELTIADEGIGIEAAFMPHLFQRFRQADTGNARRHGGLGLGLSIVSSLVQLHRGQIRASSDGRDAGATFTVTFPLENNATTARSLQSRTSEQVVEPDHLATNVRVLVVDDDADVRGALAGMLEASGATVLAMESCVTIDAALAEFRPDALVLDIGMPGEDDYALIRRIRQLPRSSGGETPAISLTAHAGDEDRQQAMNSGFQAHLPKPVHFPLLLATIRRLVSAGTPAEVAGAGTSHTTPPTIAST